MLKPIEPVTYHPLNLEAPLTVRFDGRLIIGESNGAEVLRGSVENIGPEVKLHLSGSLMKAAPTLVEHVLSHFTKIQQMVVTGAEATSLGESSSLKRFIQESGEIRLSREEFYQLPDAWMRPRPPRGESEEWTETNGVRHPVRPTMEPGVFYRRYVPSIQKTISFRTIDIERDLERFHNWHNQPRISHIWELNKSMDELRVYLENGQKDPHQFPAILEYDGEPAGYFEFYWASEDRIAPYYDHAPYDRGFHFLVGEKKFLGRANTKAMFHSVTHYLFLDDERTMRIVAEPRADNKAVLAYVTLVPGWRFVKEFDFPHKRAALLSAGRKEYFRNGVES